MKAEQVQNWHKHPVLSRVLCRLGRHDFEAHIICAFDVELRCSYCDQVKHSRAARYAGPV